MKHLVDASVISALAPTKAERPAALVGWLDRRSDDLFVSVVTAAEIRAGVAKAARHGATRKAKALASWWAAVEHLYGDRILPLDLKAATIANCRQTRRSRGGDWARSRLRRRRDCGDRRSERAHVADEERARLQADLRQLTPVCVL